MLVRDRMTAPAISVRPDMPFQEALQLMQDRHFRRLPVVNDQGKLIGIVTERDLLRASPSPATTLDVWEAADLLALMPVQDLMTQKVFTAVPDETIESAARLMVDNRVGGLPVIDDDQRPVGIITEADIFKTLIEMFGGGERSLRLTLEVPRGKGILTQVSKAIFDLGGNIVSVGTFPINAKPNEDGLVIKVQDVSKKELIDTLETLGDHVTDAREV